jgi:hypothetical protein
MWLPDTWRSAQSEEIPTMAKGELLAYLEPLAFGEDDAFSRHQPSITGDPERRPARRVKNLFHDRYRTLPFDQESFTP